MRYGDKMLIPGQGNNMYVFPAVGLAIVATKARRVTDEMFVVAARAVADQVTQAELDSGLLYPPQSNILQTEVAVAVKVAETIFARGLAGVEKPADVQDIRRRPALQAGICLTSTATLARLLVSAMLWPDAPCLGPPSSQRRCARRSSLKSPCYNGRDQSVRSLQKSPTTSLRLSGDGDQGGQMIYLAWFAVFLFNMAVPLLFALSMTRESGRIGMCSAVVLLLSAGCWICTARERPAGLSSAAVLPSVCARWSRCSNSSLGGSAWLPAESWGRPAWATILSPADSASLAASSSRWSPVQS